MNRLTAGCATLILTWSLTGAPLASPPQDPMARALRAFQAQRYEEAAPILKAYLSDRPEDPMGHYALGLVLDKLKSFDASLHHLRSAMQLKPELTPARQAYVAVVQERVYELINERRFDDALQLSEETLQLLPAESGRAEAAGAHFARGVVLFERGRQQESSQDRMEASRAWDMCRQLNPVSATGELLSGIRFFEGKDFTKAQERFEFALQLRPRNRYARMWLGLAKAELGDLEGALADLQEAQELFLQNPSIHRYIGDVQTLQEDARAAEESYSQALGLNPGDARVHASLGDLYLRGDRLPEAIDAYREAVRLRPDHLRIHTVLAELLEEAGRQEEALEVLARARELVERTPDARQADRSAVDLERALILLDQGRRGEAERLFSEQARYLSPQTTPRIHLYHAQVGSSESRLARIQQALDFRGPGARPLHAHAYRIWGDLQRSGSRRVDALDKYYQAWRRTPPHSPQLELLKARFESTRQDELSILERRTRELPWLIDPLYASGLGERLRRKIELLRALDLGPPGDLTGPRLQRGEVSRALIPGELAGELSQHTPPPHQDEDRARFEPSWRDAQDTFSIPSR